MTDKFTMPRLNNWPVLLTRFLMDSRKNALKLRLDWKHVVCAGWAGQCVEAITAVNPYLDLGFGSIRSPAGATRAIKRAGYDDLRELMADCFITIPVVHARRGDLVATPLDPHYSGEYDTSVMPIGIGIADPPFFWCVTPEGLASGVLADVESAYLVGAPPEHYREDK